MIYLDNNATTSAYPEVVEAMLPFFTEKFGNPSSLYELAQQQKDAIESSRQKVAEILGVQPKEIVFTSGGTEAVNTAIIGSALAQQEKGKYIITSKIEHKAVLETCKFLQKYLGYEITYLSVDSSGVIDLDELKNSIRSDTVLVSIMYANNETGVIQPIQEIGKIVKQANVPFHSDVVQAIGKIPVNLSELGVDYASISGHKFHGPRGIGILYRRKGAPFTPLIRGGAHENKMRAGTENTPGIVGIATALEIASREINNKMPEIEKLRDRLQQRILDEIPEVIVNGGTAPRVPNTLNIAIKYVEGEAMLFLLDNEGILASSGSACTSGSLEPSYVLLAMGLDHATAHGSLRFSLGKDNTQQQIDKVVDVLAPIVQKLRNMSPFCPDELKK
ncbi:cysteine desulfurase NifS [bacterium]|nr:MAG: cysteine desulfurase NifS [bacterium]